MKHSEQRLERITTVFSLSCGGGVAGLFVGLIFGVAFQIIVDLLQASPPTVSTPFLWGAAFGIIGMIWGLILGLSDTADLPADDLSNEIPKSEQNGRVETRWPRGD